jgi:YD repeat-containing protein
MRRSLRPSVRLTRWTSLLSCLSLWISAVVNVPIHVAARSPRKPKTVEQSLNPLQPQPQRGREPAPKDAGKKVDLPPTVETPRIVNLPTLDEMHSRKDKKPEAPAPVPSNVPASRKIKIKKISRGDSSKATNRAMVSSIYDQRKTKPKLIRSHHARVERTDTPLPDGNTYTASVDFSTTQGYRNWYYLDSSGAQMYFNGWAWQGPETYLLLWGNGGHPGNVYDAVRQWRAPSNGSVHITGSVADANTSCGSGVIVSIKQGTQVLWQQAIDNGNTTGFSYDVTTSVGSGDQINFVINNRGDWGCDSTNFDPTIVFTAGTGGASASERAMARLDPFNQTGNQVQARDCEWSLPLVSLPGRSGLDLGLTLSYSSMVWTPVGSYIYFDEDNGSPSPGFRLGFPTIGNVFLDTQANVNARIMVTSSGRRVEFRYATHAGSYDLYKASDSSYAELLDYGSSIWLRTTDGTNINFGQSGGEWHAVLIRDRNGNQISASYNGYGDLTSVTDTLGRLIIFNYDGNANLNSITQTWNGQTD